MDDASQTDFDQAFESNLVAAYHARLHRPTVDVSTQLANVVDLPTSSSALTTAAIESRAAGCAHGRLRVGAPWQQPTAVMVGSTAAKLRQLGWREAEDAYHRHRRMHPVEDMYNIAVEQLVPVIASGGLPPLKHRRVVRGAAIGGPDSLETVSWTAHAKHDSSTRPKQRVQAPMSELEQQLYLHPSIASTLPLDKLLRIEEAARRRARATRARVVAMASSPEGLIDDGRRAH
jgi:uncharacterized protein YgbK (DUF1537 family)